MVWGFTARLAEILKAKYPDKKLATLAYNLYVNPPSEDIKLPDNIDVRICVRPPIVYFGSKEAKNKSYGIVDAWLKRVSEFSVWQYHTNFGGSSIYPLDVPNIIHDFYLRYKGKMTSAVFQPNNVFSKEKSTWVIKNFPLRFIDRLPERWSGSD